MERAFEYRIYPNAVQRSQIECTFGCCRWVYNRALDMRIKAYKRRGENTSAFELMKMLPVWKKPFPWLAQADSVSLQQALRDLDKAYKNFFRAPGKVGYPKFKSKRDNRQSYRTENVNGKNIAVPDDKHVKLPKLGAVKARISRMPEGRILSATVKRTPTGKYFVVLCCADCPVPQMPLGPVEVMGIDVGIKDLMVRSDGVRVANPKNLTKAEKKLARAQRRLARKQKGSKNREKQRILVARCHEQVANRRKDALHKATTDAIRESQAVAVEDLNVKGMMSNRHLAKAVADASMGEMRRQLAYKAAWYGRGYAEVSRWFPSSKFCPDCGCVFSGLTLAMREWDCPDCGAHHDRDLNAAGNIADEGRRILEGTAGHAETAA